MIRFAACTVILLFAQFAIAADAPPAEAEIRWAFNTLNDTRAGSNHKMMACAILEKVKVKRLDIAVALGRQSHADMAPVREAAKIALITHVGPQLAQAILDRDFELPEQLPPVLAFQPLPVPVIRAPIVWRLFTTQSAYVRHDLIEHLALSHISQLSIVTGLLGVEHHISTTESLHRALIKRTQFLISQGRSVPAGLLQGWAIETDQIDMWLKWQIVKRDRPGTVIAAAKLLGELTGQKGKHSEAVLGALKNLTNDDQIEDAVTILAGAEHTDRAMEYLCNKLTVGELVPPRMWDALKADDVKLSAAILLVLKSNSGGARRAALVACASIKKHSPELLVQLNHFMRDTDVKVRQLAADAVGTDSAKRLILVPDVIAKLRNQDPLIRADASRRLHELGVFDDKATLALINAVEKRDLVLREGLVLILEKAFFAGITEKDAAQVLMTSITGPPLVYTKTAFRELSK